ncbi:MAG: HAMP domain-containing protein [bacterium]
MLSLIFQIRIFFPALLSFIFNRRVLCPLVKLNQAVSVVAKGDLTVRSATEHNDELGDLSRTLDAIAIVLVNEMKKEIAKRNSTLQSR